MTYDGTRALELLRLGTGFPNAMFRDGQDRIEDRPEQKTMANSTQQARNTDGSLAIVPATVRDEPALLVDDMVDSRWTLTVTACLLRKQ